MRGLFLNDLSDPRIGSSIRQMYQQGARLRELGHETALATAVEDASQAGETEIEGMRVFRVHSDYPVRFRGYVSLEMARCENPSGRSSSAPSGRRARPSPAHAPLLRVLTAAREAGAGSSSRRTT